MKIKIYKPEQVYDTPMSKSSILYSTNPAKIFTGTLVFSMGPVENDLDEFLRKYQNLINAGVPEGLGLDVGVL